MAWGRDQGARTLQWVGGEPTIHLPAVLRSMAALPALPRIVWKSDFYGTPAAFELLEGVVDVYVADFKFGNDACARAIAGVDRYFEVVTRNLHQAAGQGDLIVRHLRLPGHMDCCFRRVVAWMAESLPRAKFSLRDGYRPHWTAKNDASLSRSIAADERAAALRLARSAHLNLIA